MLVLIFALIVAMAATSVTTILVRALSGDPHYRAAVAEARHLLSLAHIPPGAREVSRAPVDLLRSPAMQQSSDHLVDKFRWFTVPGSMNDVFGWIQSHPPVGLRVGAGGNGSDMESVSYTGDPDTDAYVAAQLQVTVTPDGPSRTAMRVDGMDIWLTSKPAQYQPRMPQVRVTIGNGCPSRLSDFADVRNARDGLTSRMLPSNNPIGGIICRYGEGRIRLTRKVALSASSARELAAVIRRIWTGSAGSFITSCPTDQGSAEILVFGFKGRPDVALWYHDAGCQSLDNGYISSVEVGNSSFYSAFLPLIERLSR